MVLKRTPNGALYQEPPYSAAEEVEFYRRISGGPVTVVKPAPAAAPKRKSPSIKRRVTPKDVK
jgi:hypothetical protein